ncbi:MAG: hypothetical protein II320_04920, partial [Oscillospiraceae bacterium]|nr:hypothetical protein [Oscillospiraceae bacterium]
CDGKGRRGDRLGRSHTLPAPRGAVHLPGREGMRRPGAATARACPRPTWGRIVFVGSDAHAAGRACAHLREQGAGVP